MTGRDVTNYTISDSETGNRTPGICVTGRDVTNYTISDVEDLRKVGHVFEKVKTP